MARDVVFHGDLVEFLASRRCQACQQGDRKCIINEGDEHCIFCSDAKEPCVFERQVLLTGPKPALEWATLVNEDTKISLFAGKRFLRPADPTSSITNGSAIIVEVSELRRLRRELANARWEILVSEVGKRFITTWRTPRISDLYAKKVKRDSDRLSSGNAARARWKKAICTVCKNISKAQLIQSHPSQVVQRSKKDMTKVPSQSIPEDDSYRSANRPSEARGRVIKPSERLEGYESLVFDLDMRPIKRQRREFMTTGRQACSGCQLNGIKCTHPISTSRPVDDFFHARSLDGSTLSGGRSEFDSKETTRTNPSISSHSLSNRQVAGTNGHVSFQDIQDLESGSEPPGDEEMHGMICDYEDCRHISKNKSERKKHMSRHSKPYQCSRCEKSFSTQNDLQRHLKSVHKIQPQHGIYQNYQCAALNCTKREKIWPRLDNFRQHCQRIHKDQDTDDLVRRSMISPIVLAELPSGENAT